MTTRCVFNLTTGELTTVPLTPTELDAAVVAKAAEDAFNAPDNVAARAIDATDRLWFEVNFNQENRIRALESKLPMTRAQYRDALIITYKNLA
jgi:hypothetical protein